MAEENVNATTGIKESTVQKPRRIELFAASIGLKEASVVCLVFIWIGVILAVIGIFIFLGNLGSSSSETERVAGLTCFAYGIGGAIFSYFLKKILIGLSVITEASELYLSTKK
jgi:hypothetical protein